MIIRHNKTFVFASLLMTLGSMPATAENLLNTPLLFNNHYGKADFMTPAELEVIMEINRVRTDPAGYARKYLAPLREYYQGALFRYPGKIAIRTKEGVAALDECIRELEYSNPAPALSPCPGLTFAARDLVRDQGETGMTGHKGSDGSSIAVRISRYGQWYGPAAENIAYGLGDAREIVIAWLVDDGVAGRGHRINLLNGELYKAGVHIGPHRRYNDMCVMDFASSYVTKKP